MPISTPTRNLIVALACLSTLALSIACDGSPSLSEIEDMQRAGDYAETVEPLRALIETHPDDPKIHLLYGRALAWTGDPRLAIWSLRKAAEDPQLKVQAQLEMASAGIRGGNWQAAIEAANAVLEDDPDHIAARIARGEAYLSEGREADLALEDFEVVLDQEPDNTAAMASRAAALLLAGHAEEAAEALEELRAVVDDENNREGPQARICATLAVFEAERGQFEEAEKRFMGCLERFPAHAVLIEPAMEFYDVKGEPERATALLEEALELSPRSQSYRRRLAERAIAAGDLDRADEILLAGVEFEETELQIAAWTDLTNHYLLIREDLPAALRAYEEALALTEEPSQLAILTHADLLARAGRHDRALDVAATLENDAYRGLIEARVHLDQGRPAEALARLEQVFPSWPNNAGARYYAARAAEQLGDFKRAIEEYRQSIRSAPDQTEAALRLAKIYYHAGSRANAWTNASQYFQNFPDDPEAVRLLIASSAGSDRVKLQRLFTRLRPTKFWPLAIALRADAEAARTGTDAGLALIDEAKGLDLKRPRNAELLRSKAILLSAAGRIAEARAELDASLAAAPDSADFREIEGMLIEAEGGSAANARAAYEKAVELDANQWRALTALARLSLAEGQTDRALVFFDRATEAIPENPTAAREAAEAALAANDLAGAEKRFEILLREHPWDSLAAERLARMRLARGDTGARTLELSERAVLFQGRPESKALLADVYDARGEKARADRVREAIASGKKVDMRGLDSTEGSEN